MSLIALISIAILAGSLVVALFGRPSDRQAADMGVQKLDSSERRQGRRFSIGLGLALTSSLGVLDAFGMPVLGFVAYAAWLLAGLGVMFVRNAVPVDSGMPDSGFAAGARTWVLALCWPVATFVLPRA